MESQPQNPEFRNNPENLHPCIYILEGNIPLSCLETNVKDSTCLISLGLK